MKSHQGSTKGGKCLDEQVKKSVPHLRECSSGGVSPAGNSLTSNNTFTCVWTGPVHLPVPLRSEPPGACLCHDQSQEGRLPGAAARTCCKLLSETDVGFSDQG